MVAQGYRTVRAETWRQPNISKATGEKFCSSIQVMTAPQISRKQLQKTDLRPSAPLRNEEQDKRQRGFVTGKAH